MNQSSCRRVTLAVLAGGDGSRMGMAKGQIRIGGAAILSYLLDRLNWPGPKLLVTAPGRQRPPGCERFDAEAHDAVAGQGPLRGIQASLKNSVTDLVAILTVDMPAVTRAQIEWLVEQMCDRPQAQILMTRRSAGSNEFIEPFPSIFRRSVMPLIEGKLDRGKRSVQGLGDLPNTEVLPAPPEWSEEVWTNLNDQADLEAYVKSLIR